jgi:3-deoxy-D-manno-octulosonate 8-phosphate phosphatase (KDO 8-P phosphatase)
LTLQDRCRRIELLVVDVDGVLTDGSIIYGNNEVELKVFHVRDGSGLKLWEKAGKRSAILSGRSASMVAIRAAEVGVSQVIQGAADKLSAFQGLLEDLEPEKVCYIGDDLPDLPVLLRCGLAVAVADACPEVIAAAHYVTRAAGGRGAVRETIELILSAQGLWQKLLAPYRNE